MFFIILVVSILDYIYEHDIDILNVSQVFDISNNEISKNTQKLEKLFPSYFRKLKINKLLNV